MDPINTLPPLLCNSHKLIQQGVGTFLYYAHAVDPTMLTTLSDISSQQFQAACSALTKFLNYCASYPNATIMYQTPNMTLKLHSDSSYLNSLGAQNCDRYGLVSW